MKSRSSLKDTLVKLATFSLAPSSATHPLANITQGNAEVQGQWEIGMLRCTIGIGI